MPFNGTTFKWEAPNNRGHIWKTEEDGDVDIFGLEAGNHNGPVCINCGYAFCHHCQDLPDEDCQKPAIDAEFHEVKAPMALIGSSESEDARHE